MQLLPWDMLRCCATLHHNAFDLAAIAMGHAWVPPCSTAAAAADTAALSLPLLAVWSGDADGSAVVSAAREQPLPVKLNTRCTRLLRIATVFLG